MTPDYVMADRFVPTGAGILDFAGVDQLSYDSLPADGFSALYRTGSAIRDNRAQNFAGIGVSAPVTRVTAIEYYNASLDH